MSLLDTYYRAFKEYRKETVDNTLCEKDRKELAASNPEGDRLEAIKYLCTIEEDWIQKIEEGLVYVEKAVQEERQFIRTNGEVVPIEKVKRISKDSVEHLAKHSEMITHVPEEEDETVVPDKLYMVEKLSDYAVYENRFLYMMLCYLRDFIDFRLEKIENLRRTYIGEMEIHKEVKAKKRTLIVESKVYEKRTDNPFPIADEKSAKMVQRIKDCQSIVNSLLGTELMTQVAKSPMIKPPIVKTNVLKMNNNFKRALALYDYIASYKGDGYSYEEVKYDFAPYSEKVADEIAEAANLTAFLSYKVGNDIEDELERAYKKEEIRRREEEEKKLADRIKRLKKRALESNKTLEEYMLLLEERNRMLEKDSETLVLLRQEVEELHAQIDDLTREKEELNRRIEELERTIEEKNEEIVALKQKYIEDMAALKKEHEQEIYELNAAHEDAMQDLQAQHEEEIKDLKVAFGEKMQEVIGEYEQRENALQEQISLLTARYREAVESYDSQVAALNEQIADLNSEQTRLVNEYEGKLKELEENYRNEFAMQEQAHASAVGELNEKTTFIQAELDGLRAQHGKLTPSADYASRERFLELQEEFLAFEKYFKDQWKVTKKEIRRQWLWAKQTKPNKKSKD